MNKKDDVIHRQGYRFRLELKQQHLDHLNQSLGANRFVWNKLLALNLWRLENQLPLLWYNEMAGWIAFWKQSEDYAFLRDAPSQSLQQTAKTLEQAFKGCLRQKPATQALADTEKTGQKRSRH